MDKKTRNQLFKRALRKTKTQSCLAQRMGVSRQMINKIIKGISPVPKDWHDRLLNITQAG